MNRMLSLVMVLILMVSMTGSAFAEAMQSEGAGTPEATMLVKIEDYVDWETPQELVVGSATPLSGYFFTDMWGNNASDMDVRALIHGYSTVAWGYDGFYSVDNTVVNSVSVSDDSAGNRTYTFSLHSDLTYNNGSQITVKDYVFSALLLAAPEMMQLGSVPTSLDHLIGYDAYREGDPFSGVRLLSEDSFSLTIAAENLPHYYELALVNITPYPMSVIAPGCDIVDDGEGAYIIGAFTKELLEETVMNAQTGYLFNPQVTCGPFNLVSYDSTTHVAIFEKNSAYKGNFEGQIPIIEKLTFRSMNSSTAIEEINNGTLDIANKVSDKYAIAEGFSSIGEDALGAAVYLRSGFSFLSFACEMGPTQSEAVRKAIAMCVDVPTLIDEFLGNNGLPVYGYYGLGQWMAADNQEALDDFAIYDFDIQAAITLLIRDGWRLNAQGEAYDSGIRYRQNKAGELEALQLNWAKAEGTAMNELLEAMLVENFASAGIGLTVTEMPFSEMLMHYYRQNERTYNLFNLATNFSMIFDPYYAFDTGDLYQGVFNTTGIKDEQLMELAKAMRQTPVGDDEAYLQKWFAFQARWVEVLPMVPLYTNVYFDFSRPGLQNYYPNSHFSWAAAIMYAYIGEPLPIEDELLDDAEFDF